MMHGKGFHVYKKMETCKRKFIPETSPCNRSRLRKQEKRPIKVVHIYLLSCLSILFQFRSPKLVPVAVCTYFNQYFTVKIDPKIATNRKYKQLLLCV